MLPESLQPHLQRLERRLAQHLHQHPAPEGLQDALAYSLLQGGKRLRPAFLYAAALSCTTEPDWPACDAAAAALECIHAYSLVHDDLPAMDNDLWRRGQPSTHARFGEATAILVGDGLLTEAFALLSQTPHPHTTDLVRVVSHAAGWQGMLGGQYLDVCAPHARTPEDIAHMHALKTGALFQAAGAMAAWCCCRSEQVDSLSHLGHLWGQVYQLWDDWCDQGENKSIAPEQAHAFNAYGVAGTRTLLLSQLKTLMHALPKTTQGHPEPLRALSALLQDKVYSALAFQEA